MEKQYKHNKGNVVIILLVIIVLVVLAFWWLMKSGYKVPGQTAQVPSNQIQDASGLDAAAKELDGTNVNQMDSGINQVAQDSSSF